MNQNRLPDQIPPPSAAASAPTAAWAAWVREQWEAVRLTLLEKRPPRVHLSAYPRLRVTVHLGSLSPADVVVEAAAGEPADTSREWPIRLCSMQSYGNGTYVFEGLLPPHDTKDQRALTVRVRPAAAHEELSALREVARAFDGRSEVASTADAPSPRRPEWAAAGPHGGPRGGR